MDTLWHENLATQVSSVGTGVHGEATLSREEALKQLLPLIERRLFAQPVWLPDENTIGSLGEELVRLGLQQPVLERPGELATTPLGKDLNVELLMAFLGVWVEWHIPMVLEEQGYISDDECEEILEQFEQGASAETLLRPLVIEAYLKFYGASRLKH